MYPGLTTNQGQPSQHSQPWSRTEGWRWILIWSPLFYIQRRPNPAARPEEGKGPSHPQRGVNAQLGFSTAVLFLPFSMILVKPSHPFGTSHQSHISRSGPSNTATLAPG